MDIWISLKNNSSILLKKTMTAKQLDEINRIDNLIKDLLILNFNKYTKFNSVCKDEFGYYYGRECSKGCDSIWRIKVNIQLKKFFIFCNNQCDHFNH